MRNRQLTQFSLSLVMLVFSLSASAANAVRVDAKKVLGLQEGKYKVIKVEHAQDGEEVCVLNDTEKMAWFGSAESPVLGMARTTFLHVNEGLVPDESPDYSHGCKYSFSTQTQDHHFISDAYSTGCDDGNKTTHIEATIRGDVVEYRSETKFPRGGKVLSVSSQCTLQKIASPKP